MFNQLKRLLIPLLLIIILGLSAWLVIAFGTPSYVKGYRAFQKKEYPQAIKYFLPLVQKNSELQEYALYYLAESLYQSSFYNDAANNYKLLQKNYPQGRFHKEIGPRLFSCFKLLNRLEELPTGELIKNIKK